MGEKPDGKTIDRIDNNGNYEPKNCRWATLKEQRRNTRRSRYITAFGKTMTLAGWAELYQVNPTMIQTRLDRQHLTPEVALTKPNRYPNGHRCAAAIAAIKDSHGKGE